MHTEGTQEEFSTSKRAVNDSFVRFAMGRYIVNAAKAKGRFFMERLGLIASAYVLATILIAIAAGASLSTFNQISSASDARKYGAASILNAQALMIVLINAENGERSFALTGDETFLYPYGSLHNDVRDQLAALRARTVAVVSAQHLDALALSVEDRLKTWATIVQLRRGQDYPAIRAIVLRERDRQTMNRIRANVNGFVRAETRELERQSARFDTKMRQMFVVIIAICLLALLIAIAFAYFTYRESQHRLKTLVHQETEHLLRTQEDVNRQLQSTNTNLHISEERLAVTLNSIDDAVIATDAEGHVTLLNPLAERLTGWTRAEAYGRPIEDIFHIIHADTREPYAVPVRECLEQGTTLSLANHTIAIARDGTECHIADSCAPILDRAGKVVGAVLVFRDVTERRRLDEILHEKTMELERSTVIAEKANLAKSDFLSSMSHELRTPLSAILGFAQLIDSGTPLPTPVQQRGLDQILKAGWYLLTLINEILDLALIESGKLSLSMEPMPINDILHECHTMVEPQAQQRNIRMSFPDLEDGPVVYVNGDRTRVKQVLINLLSNAIKYNAPGGRVTVQYETIEQNRVRISVSDTGAGLLPDQIAQLFQPFNRLGQEEGTEQGTGIGLVMSKKLMELMGGIIGVESTLGRGSKFWIDLNPSTPPQVIVDPAGAETIEMVDVLGTRVYTLLYVEDNPANLLLVQDIVSRRPDIHLLSARDGMTGVKMAFNEKPDVILMDINLPGISGIHALRILKDSPVTMHIPVIALSANAMQRDIEKGLEGGFFRYLTKPIRINEFMDTLDIAFKLVDTPTAHPWQEVVR